MKGNIKNEQKFIKNEQKFVKNEQKFVKNEQKFIKNEQKFIKNEQKFIKKKLMHTTSPQNGVHLDSFTGSPLKKKTFFDSHQKILLELVLNSEK